MAKLEIGLTRQEDLTWIEKNIEKCIIKPFKIPDIKEVFEICPWSLTVRREGNLIGFAAFTDYPIGQYESSKWVKQLQNIIKPQKYDGLNTLFLHVFMCDAEPEACLQNVLKETFCFNASLKWCCFLAEGSAILDRVISENFTQERQVKNGTLQVWYAKRDDYIPYIGIRSKRCEDYLALRNLFSQMYPTFSADSLQQFTLDFLDFGEDRCPTYKYFTYDADNTYIAVADTEDGEAIGFIYATTQHADLDMMNALFQLEAVYGLRKYVPTAFEMSSDEEEVIKILTTDSPAEEESTKEITACLHDILDEICETRDSEIPKTKEESSEEKLKLLFNSEAFDLSNDDHSSLITSRNLKYFNSDTVVRLINSKSFDVNNTTHTLLVPILGTAVYDISPERMDEIINSDTFNPADEGFARISALIITKMPPEKIEMFRKSAIGSDFYEKATYKKIQAKTKGKPRVLSYSEIQLIKRKKENTLRLTKKKDIPTENIEDSEMPLEKKIDLKKIHYRNMGFISGIAFRGQYRIQNDYSLPKIKEPFGFIENEDSEKKSEMDFNIDIYERYPIPHYKEDYLPSTIPVYKENENSLFIEQFAIEKDYESLSLFLIMAAFNYFPKVDYCMLLLPYGTNQVPYLRRHFTQIPARPFCTYDKELYVYHKNGFHLPYQTRRYEKSDYQGTEDLIKCSCLKENLTRDLDKVLIPSTTQMDAIVLISEDKILGIAIVSEIKKVEIIKRSYDIAEREQLKYHKYRKHGLLLHCVLHPIAKFLSNVFLKEVMRISNKSILYYKIYPSHVIPHNPSLWQSLCNILEHLLPLRPSKKTSSRLSITVNTINNENVNNKNENDNCYSLCYVSTKWVLRDKRINSSRIVVLGTSDIALGILESLIYNSSNRFINLTIITKNNIASEFRFDEKCCSFLPLGTDYTQSVVDSLCLPAWVTIVRGDLVAIEQKQVRLTATGTANRKEFSVGFDYLALCVDTEFQTTHVKKVSLQKEHSIVQKKHPMLKYLWEYEYSISENTANVYTVNCVEDATKILNWLWRYFLRKAKTRDKPKVYKSFAEKERDMRDSRIIIYGQYMEAYTSLAVILTENFPHSKITFVKPPSNVGKSKFYSSYTEEAFDFVLQNSELEVYFDTHLMYDKESSLVDFVDLVTPKETLRLDCCTVLIFDIKSTNHSMFKALHHSDLSYILPLRNSKGHPYLLINTKFQTNVENIFAAGNITQMHFNNNIVTFEDCIYNLREMGILVGNNISKTVVGETKINNTLPTFKSPSVTYAKLPFKYIYIHIQQPSHLIQLEKGVEEIALCPEEIVLGNLKTGAAIIPEQTSEETHVQRDEDENTKIEEVSSDQSIPEQEAEFENVSTNDSNLQQEEVFQNDDDVTKIWPAEPEYFAIAFDQSAHVRNIECLTKADVEADSLIQLYGIHVTQLYNILGIIKEEDSEKVSFSLADEWILPLDYLTFTDKAATSEQKQKLGYEGYWRKGYPESEELKLNGFLDSFTKIKSKK
ncbi:uncharacterized protein LOC118201376 [Stegodyphus dumicola]|uniref:uncharacterized protein LOC118201376 n=1 Tax=Stegodyphus dumicola TaxID=202533 RepID=UPI0015B20115|nr:uncharacterized protein LOC118201376 [Stegodyphus dumicola]